VDKYGVEHNSITNALKKGAMVNKTVFFADIFKTVTVKISSNRGVKLIDKLHHYTHFIISRSRSTDALMWNKGLIHSVTMETKTDEIAYKLLIDIIPKADIKMPITGLIAKTISSQLDWGFRHDFKLNTNMISNNADDSDVSDADRFDINSAKINESKKIFNDYFCEKTIDTIFERKKFILNEDEYNFYMDLDINQVQNQLVRNYFANPFGGWNNLDGVRKKEFIKLLVFLLHELRKGKRLVYLPHILVAKSVKSDTSSNLRKSIERRITGSHSYKSILERYSYTLDKVKSEFIIESPINQLFSYDYTYNTYGYPDNGKPILIKENDDIKSIVCDEYLRFLMLMQS
jgi:hypothetical protein